MKYASRSNQQGMALLISLVVLIVVSILGATAMRSAAFQSKVSVNAQASQILFQSSESGLAAVEAFADAQVAAGTLPQEITHIFSRAYNGTPQRVCYSAAGTATSYSDATRTVIDNNNIALNYPAACPQVAGSPAQVTTVVARPPCALDAGSGAQGYSLNAAGGSFGKRTIYVQSFSQVAGLGFTGSHVQLWQILGAGSGSCG